MVVRFNYQDGKQTSVSGLDCGKDQFIPGKLDEKYHFKPGVEINGMFVKGIYNAEQMFIPGETSMNNSFVPSADTFNESDIPGHRLDETSCNTFTLGINTKEGFVWGLYGENGMFVPGVINANGKFQSGIYVKSLNQ